MVDIAYTETAALADYVLPAASQHEKWEYTLFTFEWPTNYFHVRRPLFEPLEGTLPESEIYARLFERLGVLPGAAVLSELTDVARHDRRHLLQRAGEVTADHPGLSDIVPVLLYRTLGATLPGGAAHVAPLWLACHRAVAAGRKEAFGPTGKGYLDFANMRWQAGKRSGAVDALRALRSMKAAARQERNTSAYGEASPSRRPSGGPEAGGCCQVPVPVFQSGSGSRVTGGEGFRRR